VAVIAATVLTDLARIRWSRSTMTTARAGKSIGHQAFAQARSSTNAGCASGASVATDATRDRNGLVT